MGNQVLGAACALVGVGLIVTNLTFGLSGTSLFGGVCTAVGGAILLFRERSKAKRASALRQALADCESE